MSGFRNQAKQRGMRVLKVRMYGRRAGGQTDRKKERKHSSGTQGRERLAGQETHLNFTKESLSGGHL